MRILALPLIGEAFFYLNPAVGIVIKLNTNSGKKDAIIFAY